jgi:hypothetical protein
MIAGGSRSMESEEIWEQYATDTLQAILEDTDDLDSLSSYHNAMFDKAMDAGVDKSLIARKMENVNFDMARKHMLDQSDAMFITRKSMEQFDRPVACDILRSQILGIGQLVEQLFEDQNNSGDGSDDPVAGDEVAAEED